MTGYKSKPWRMGAIIAVMLAIAMVAAACGSDDDDGSGGDGLPGEGVTLTFGDYNWDSAQIQTRVAQFIAEHGYGYTTDAVFGDTIGLFTALQQGDTDISMEIWLPNQEEAWNSALAADPPKVKPVGKSLEDNWQSMFVVPKYVVDENPDLQSVEDLKKDKFKQLFSGPETGGKARLVTCIPGWECEKINAEKVAAYGLEDHVEMINPGSGAGLFADLQGAYAKGDPWLGYLWGPTKPAAELDLVLLEEPAYSDACWESGKGCAYPVSEVLIAINPSVEDEAAPFIEVLEKWDFTAASQVAAEGWMADNDATVDDAAIWYLENQEATWTQWVPADVAERIKAALATQT